MEERKTMVSQIPQLHKRVKVSETRMLKDMTNRYEHRSRMKFGDSTMIELVKNKQRKILKDINHLKNGILEVEKEIARIREIEIPTTLDSTRNSMIALEDEQLELQSIRTAIQAIDDEILATSRQEEMHNTNMNLEHSIACQDHILKLQTEYQKREQICQDNYIKTSQSEDLVPKSLHLSITELTSKHDQMKDQYADLVTSATAERVAHETELKKQMDQFKLDKEEQSAQLQASIESNIKSNEKNISYRQEKIEMIDKTVDAIKELTQSIGIVEDTINDLVTTTIPLNKTELVRVSDTKDCLVSEHEKTLMHKLKIENELKVQTEKLECAYVTNKQLKTAINKYTET